MTVPFSKVMIGILLLTFCVSGVYFIVNDFGAPGEYEITIDPAYEEAFDRTEAINDKTIVMQDKVLNMTVKKSLFLALVPDVVSLLKDSFLLPFTILGDLFTTLSDLLGLPPWVTVFFTSAVIIVLIFSFLSAVLRWNT